MKNMNRKMALFHFFDENGNHVDSFEFCYSDSICEAYSYADAYAERLGYDEYRLVLEDTAGMLYAV